MARVSLNTGTYPTTIKNFLGLHEATTSDLTLKLGEAAKMENFKISLDGCLQKRPGTSLMHALGNSSYPIRGLWTGNADGVQVTLCACNGHIYQVVMGSATKDLGELTDDNTTFFAMNDCVYILNGHEYMKWDGKSDSIEEVEGYIPLVVTASTPTGGGTTLENENMLTPKRRQRFSSDGTTKTYQLVEYPLASVDRVEVNGNPVTNWEATLKTGRVSFTLAPVSGNSNVEIWYTVPDSERNCVTKMRFSEHYNGTTDTRIFLYGDGSNRAYYCGLDEDGLPNAEYFPALNEVQVGAQNTPITAMIRHFSRLIAYKPDETYKIEYSATTLTSGDIIAAFYVKPINREVGHEAPGQIYLCDNNPMSLCQGAAYSWTLYYSSAVVDERGAKRMSDNVITSIQDMNLSKCICYDDRWRYEYWITYHGTALIYNYANETWYKYINLPNITCFTSVNNKLYFGADDGCLYCIDSMYTGDCGEAISCYWESGSLDFDRSWKKKWTHEMFIGLKPTASSEIKVTAMSDTGLDYYTKTLSMGESNFSHVNFAKWTFIWKQQERAIRARIRVPRFMVMKVVLESESADSTATITDMVLMTRMPRKVRK